MTKGGSLPRGKQASFCSAALSQSMSPSGAEARLSQFTPSRGLDSLTCPPRVPITQSVSSHATAEKMSTAAGWGPPQGGGWGTRMRQQCTGSFCRVCVTQATCCISSSLQLKADGSSLVGEKAGCNALPHLSSQECEMLINHFTANFSTGESTIVTIQLKVIFKQ